jgi:hypothetical protein
MKDNRVPDLYIEQLLLDELPEQKKRQLLENPEVRRRLEELKAENRRILEEYPPEEMGKVIRNRIEWSERSRAERSAQGRAAQYRPERAAASRPRFSWPRLVPATGVVLLVLVGALVLVTRGPSFFAPRSQAEEIRLKGGTASADTGREIAPYLNVYMQTESGARLLQEGERVSEGTTLQVGYVAGENKHGTIVSVDGRGAVTVHFPVSAVTGQSLGGPGEVLLPFAYTLDDAPAFERFFFIADKKPFSVEKVIEAAEELAQKPENAKNQDLDLPRGLEQSSILLLK